jgi:heat shock protein HslJ
VPLRHPSRCLLRVIACVGTAALLAGCIAERPVPPPSGPPPAGPTALPRPPSQVPPAAASAEPSLSVFLDPVVIDAPADELDPPLELAHTSWQMVMAAGRPVVRSATLGFVFADTSFMGTGGCNQISGRYRFDPSDGDLAILSLFRTERACLLTIGPPNLLMDQDDEIAAALATVRHGGLDDVGRLVLDGPAGRFVLLPRPWPPGLSPGAEWP